MTIYVGGLRARLIKDSLYNMIHASLDDLGWFDTGRGHQAIAMRATKVENEEEIPLNTLAVCDEDFGSFDTEMGSKMADHSWTFYADFYAENEAVGLHMIRDIKDILEGRMSAISRSRPTLDVYDYTQATPTAIFTCQIEDVLVDRAHDFPKPWQKFWFACRFSIEDTYGDDDDS